jgi:DNA-binding NarL/FixJ family response regulator
MGGSQFLEELRKTHPPLPVVIVTGYPEGDLLKQATLYAPVMRLSKAIEPELLERTVRSVVSGKAASIIRGTQR